jgi:hypothetical protein
MEPNNSGPLYEWLYIVLYLGAEVSAVLQEAKEIDRNDGVAHLCVLGPVGRVRHQVHQGHVVQRLVGLTRPQQRVQGLLLLQQLLHTKYPRQNITLKVHKIENFFFFDFDFGICVISLLGMSKY